MSKIRRDWQSEPFKTLVTLGESTTAGGWSSSPDRCWASVLATLINDFQDEPVNFFNSGIGANVISNKVPSYDASGKPAANERLEKHVIAYNPDLLVIAYGLNDARGGTPPVLLRNELSDIIDTVRQRCDPLIVLLGPYYVIRRPELERKEFRHGTPEIYLQFNDLIHDLASEKDCLFCDVWHPYGDAEWLIHYDGVHANDLGHRIIAHEIFRVLAQNCSGLALRTKRLEKTSPRWRDESMLRADYGYTKKIDGRWYREIELTESEFGSGNQSDSEGEVSSTEPAAIPSRSQRNFTQ